MRYRRRSRAYSDLIIASAPVAYWRLGETSGTVARDSVGTNHGTYINGPVLGRPAATGMEGNGAVQFDGINDYVTVPDAPALDLGNLFSLEMMVKRNYVGAGFLALMGKDFNQPQPAFNNDALYLDDAGVGAVVTETGTIADTRWHHVLFTYNGTVAKIIKDGVDVSGATTARTFIDNAFPLLIGAFATTGTYFNGTLDEVAIYKRAMTIGEAVEHSAAAGR